MWCAQCKSVQDNHNVKWHVRFSCLLFPSVLHMAATHSSQRSSGFSSSQVSADECLGTVLAPCRSYHNVHTICSVTMLHRAHCLWYLSPKLFDRFLFQCIAGGFLLACCPVAHDCWLNLARTGKAKGGLRFGCGDSSFESHLPFHNDEH